MSGDRPTVLLVADRPDWAYDHIARFVGGELHERYDFYYDFVCFNKPPRRLGIRKQLGVWRYYLRYAGRRRLIKSGQSYDLVCYLGWYFPFVGSFTASGRAVIQGIYTDGFPPQGHTVRVEPGISVQDFAGRYLANSKVVLAGSKAIYDRYRPHVKGVQYATGAIDTAMFRPMDRPKIDNGAFVVGWTGDPSRPFKGFQDFVVPAVQEAARRRPGIILKTRFSGPLPTLPQFYRDVDIVLIASMADAGPNCFLEAGACGVPAISTRIGFPLETIREGENGMLVERSVSAMADALVRAHDNRALLACMGEQIRRDIEDSWGFKSRSRLWIHAFDEALRDA